MTDNGQSKPTTAAAHPAIDPQVTDLRPVVSGGPDGSATAAPAPAPAPPDEPARVPAAIVSAQPRTWFGTFEAFVRGAFADPSTARDRSLVVLAVIYFIGYAAWSVYALQNNLGPLPPIQTQYFLAGSVILVIVALLYLGVRYISFPGVLVRKLDTRLLIVVSCFSITTFLASGFSNAYHYSRYNVSELYINVISMMSMLITFECLVEFERRFSRPPFIIEDKRITSTVYMMSRAFLVVVSFSVVVFFMLFTYGQIPQAIGGGRPRCAIMELSREKISPETLEALLPPATTTPVASAGTTTPPESPVKTSRSREVNVLFQSSDLLIVRPFPLPTPAPTATAPVPSATQTLTRQGHTYEIKRSAVEVVTWCD